MVQYFTNCQWHTTFSEFNSIHEKSTDLDRSNVSNAYVSGMREELNMKGNDFNVSGIDETFLRLRI